MSKSVYMVRNLSISALKYYYPEYKKFPFILPDLFILSVEFLCEIRQYENSHSRCIYSRCIYSYVNGIAHGECKGWYDDGQLWYQHHHVNGKSHGEYKLWYKNGQLCDQHPYVNGKKHGDHKGWYENGQLRYQQTYVNNNRKHK